VKAHMDERPGQKWKNQSHSSNFRGWFTFREKCQLSELNDFELAKDEMESNAGKNDNILWNKMLTEGTKWTRQDPLVMEQHLYLLRQTELTIVWQHSRIRICFARSASLQMEERSSHVIAFHLTFALESCLIYFLIVSLVGIAQFLLAVDCWMILSDSQTTFQWKWSKRKLK
jgi:hypothetical protein